jgi:hypothetical protein
MKVLLNYMLLAIAVNFLIQGQPVSDLQPVVSDGWQIIGTVQANLANDHDGIAVHGAFNNFRHIKFKVTNAALSLIKVVVTYGDGSPDNIEILDDIPQGGESKVIDLIGVGQRKIKKIDFWYDTADVANHRASVTILGMK